VPDLQQEDQRLKNNVLPFPSLQHVPKDPPRITVWHTLGSLVILAACVGLLGLTIYALIGD
jgi:hypothetical protein